MTKTVIEVSKEDLDEMLSKHNQSILTAIENLKQEKHEPDFISRKQFMHEAGIGSTTMNKLLRNGAIQFSRKGPRIISIPYEELVKYKRGEMILK